MNNKKLLYILIALGLIFLLTQLFNQKKERSFKSELIAVDTAAITRIVLNSQADNHQEITLEKSGQQWTVRQGSIQVPAAQGSMDGILRELISIKVKSIATQSKDRWQEYEIDDSTGSRVQVFSGSKKSVDFYSGKFGFNPQANNMISYLRLAGEPQVYAVDGFQSMSFNVSFANFRNKNLVQLPDGSVSQVKLTQGATSQVLNKSGRLWSLNGQVITDSTAVDQYIQGIRNLSGTQILDGYAPGVPSSQEIELFAGDQSVSLKIFPSGDSLKPFIFFSSANPDVHFKEDSTGAFQSLITGWKTLQSKLAPKK